jgi:hypothetical protein
VLIFREENGFYPARAMTKLFDIALCEDFAGHAGKNWSARTIATARRSPSP